MRILFYALTLVLPLSLISCGKSSDKADEDSSDGPIPSTSPIASIEYDALFVVNGGDNSISVVKSETGVVTDMIRIQNGSFPHHINTRPSGGAAVLAMPGIDLSGGHQGTSSQGGDHSGHLTQQMKSAIVVIDSATGSTIIARQLEAMNHNAIFSSDSTEIWTAQMNDEGVVLVLDSTSLETVRTIPVGKNPAEVTFSRDGTKAFVANSGSNDVTVISTADKAVLKTIPTGETPVGAWAGNDDVMYVDNEKGKSMTAIDAKTLDVVRTYDLGFTPAMAATSPSGDLWVTDAENGKVVLFKSGTTDRVHEISTGAGAHAILFSSDGKAAFSTNQTDGTVSFIDSESHDVTKTVAVGAKPNGLVFIAKP